MKQFDSKGGNELIQRYWISLYDSDGNRLWVRYYASWREQEQAYYKLCEIFPEILIEWGDHIYQ